MDKKLIIALISMVCLAQVPAISAVSVERTTDPDYVTKGGYSQATAELITVSKARANGEEYYTKEEQKYHNSNPIMKFVRRFYMYADPAADDYSMLHHNIKPVPRYSDL